MVEPARQVVQPRFRVIDMPQSNIEKPETLLVVATKTDPADFFNKRPALALYEGTEGPYITNAAFETHFDPRTGEMVEASGIPVTVAFDDTSMVGIKCRGCGVYSVLDQEQASQRDSISCLACGETIHYTQEIDEEQTASINKHRDNEDDDAEMENTLTDDDDLEDDGDDDDWSNDADEDEEDVKRHMKKANVKASKGKKKKKKAKKPSIVDDEDANDDDDESEIASIRTEETAAMRADLEGVTDLTIASCVALDEPVQIYQLTKNKLAVFAGDVCVATRECDNEKIVQAALTAGYAEGLNQAIKHEGLSDALSDAGFDPVVVEASESLGRALERAETQIASQVNKQLEHATERFKTCLDTAVAGSLRGMFSTNGAVILFETLAKELASLNVGNPKTVARTVLAKSLPQFGKALLETATDLMTKTDPALAEIQTQIQNMDSRVMSFADENESETAGAATMERLIKPGQPIEGNVVELPIRETASGKRPLRGLFA